MPSLVGMYQGETGWLEGPLANQSCIERTRLNTRAMVGRKHQAQGWYLEQEKLPGRTERSVIETLGCRLLSVKDLCPSICKGYQELTNGPGTQEGSKISLFAGSRRY